MIDEERPGPLLGGGSTHGLARHVCGADHLEVPPHRAVDVVGRVSRRGQASDVVGEAHAHEGDRHALAKGRRSVHVEQLTAMTAVHARAVAHEEGIGILTPEGALHGQTRPGPFPASTVPSK